MPDFLNFTKTGTTATAPTAPPVSEDSLDDFGSETTPASGVPASVRFAEALKPAGTRVNRRPVIVVLAVLGLALGAYGIRNWRPFDVEAASASLTIESVPAGADVLAGGVSQGRTPLTVSVTPGEHDFELMYQGQRKQVHAVARAGAAVVHHVEFAPDPVEPMAPKKASIRVSTEPSKLKVVVDGVARGTSPVTIDNVDAGTHHVRVIGATKTVDRQVEVADGESASMIITATTGTVAGPAAGWLSVSAPVTLQILEGDDTIGTSTSAKIMLPTGKHEVLLTNDSIGFRERRVVQIAAGSTAKLRVELPNAPLSINAVPWAEVWLDGTRIGETPIGNRFVRLGPHDLVFRHPELGERRQTVTVTLGAPARVSVDMRKPGS